MPWQINKIKTDCMAKHGLIDVRTIQKDGSF